MWVALDVAGPLGVVAVRLAHSVPALVFGLRGGLAADRWNRRGLMISADLARAIVLVPVAIAGFTGHLPILGLVLAAFCLQTATSYFEPPGCSRSRRSASSARPTAAPSCCPPS